MYGVEVSPTLISHVTDEVIDEVRQWQGNKQVTVFRLGSEYGWVQGIAGYVDFA